MRAPSLAEAVEAYAPRLPAYRDLKLALARYRAIAATGGWPRLPAGPTLRPVMRDARVAALRARLAASGDLAAGAAHGPDEYDADLEAAVERYQRHNGLEADGLVGRRTRGALEFHPDLYARDAQVLKGLAAPFRISLRRRAPDDNRHTGR